MTIVASDNEVLKRISNLIFNRTNGNPQAIKSSIAYIENMIGCGNSLEVILSNNTILDSVRNMFAYMWEHLLDDNAKKIIATVALIYTETTAKRVAEITKIPDMQENNVIQAGSELGKAFASAIGSSMIELRVSNNGNMSYTQHGLVSDFITELLLNKRSKSVQIVNLSITEWLRLIY